MAGSVLLIVVANPAHRALFNRYLGGTAHHLVFATDGEDGFDRFGEVKPDLVIAHVEASRLDGTILCQLVRKQPRGDRVPFVLLSEEFTTPEAGRERAAIVGADGFLPFPFDRAKLNEQITPLLAFGRPETTGRGAEPLPPEPLRRLDTSPVTIERLRSAQVSPEIAIEQRTEASPVRPPRIPDLETDTRDDLPVRSPSGRLDVDSTGDLEPLEALRLHESAKIEIEAPIEELPPDASDDGRGNWSDSTEGLLAEPEAPSPVEPRAHVTDSADTVVSFLNPFLQEGRPQVPPIERVPTSVDEDAPSLDTLEAERAPRVPSTAPVARGESVRAARDDEDSFVQKAPPRVSSSRTDGRLEARPELRPPEPRAPELRAPELRAPELRAPELRAEHHVPEPSRSGLVFDEPPILDGPARDPIEELPISGVAPPLPDHSENSKQARMILEPVRELTPSASEHLKREVMLSGGRRGLDESQLGKRLAKRVRTMFRLLDEVDYYQILGVDPDTDAEHLKRAYFDLSLEFHPDRFFLLRSGDLKEKIYAIYRRISEAYAVLSDERRRAAYDAGRVARHDKRAAPELREDVRPPAPEVKGGVLDVAATSPKAKRFVELARGAMDEGDVNGARLHLAIALAYEESPALRAASERIAQLARPALR
ncbi:DnaJ domain-containing protein [Myxococcota bacterium]|nr:DnaJ domain-containing protein [Myxococcota bacterium]